MSNVTSIFVKHNYADKEFIKIVKKLEEISGLELKNLKEVELNEAGNKMCEFGCCYAFAFNDFNLIDFEDWFKKQNFDSTQIEVFVQTEYTDYMVKI